MVKRFIYEYDDIETAINESYSKEYITSYFVAKKQLNYDMVFFSPVDSDRWILCIEVYKIVL